MIWLRRLMCRWIPGTAKFVALGEYARNTGCLQVCCRMAYATSFSIESSDDLRLSADLRGEGQQLAKGYRGRKEVSFQVRNLWRQQSG